MKDRKKRPIGKEKKNYRKLSDANGALIDEPKIENTMNQHRNFQLFSKLLLKEKKKR